MFIVDDRVVYSASDLAAAARCEYALLRAFDAKLGRGPAITSDDPMLARTALLGDQHRRGAFQRVQHQCRRRQPF